MSDTIVKWCKLCRKQFKPNKRGQPKKYCSEACRKRYWEKYTEPRAVCIDCGTRLGQSSIRHKTERCARCAGTVTAHKKRANI